MGIFQWFLSLSPEAAATLAGVVVACVTVGVSAFAAVDSARHRKTALLLDILERFESHRAPMNAALKGLKDGDPGREAEASVLAFINLLQSFCFIYNKRMCSQEICTTIEGLVTDALAAVDAQGLELESLLRSFRLADNTFGELILFNKKKREKISKKAARLKASPYFSALISQPAL